MMKIQHLIAALTALLVSGCNVLGISSELYGSIAVSNKKPQQTTQSGGYVHDHYAFTVSGKHLSTPLVTKVPAGVLPEDAERVVFEKVPAGDVVIYGEVIALDLKTVLASISIPVTVEANKVATVSIWSKSAPPTGPSRIDHTQPQDDRVREEGPVIVTFSDEEGVPSPQDVTIRSGSEVLFINQNDFGLDVYFSTTGSDLVVPISDEFSGIRINLGANGGTSQVLSGSSSTRLHYQVVRRDTDGKQTALGKGYITFQ